MNIYSKRLLNYIYYFNKGIQFTYPHDLNIIEDNSSLHIFSPIEKNKRVGQGSLIINIQDRSKSQDLSQYLQWDMEILKKNNFTILENSIYKGNGSSFLKSKKDNFIFIQKTNLTDDKIYRF